MTEVPFVLKKILETRIQTMQAITLPTDIYRHDILKTLLNVEPYSKQLSSFIDYLINYISELTLENGELKDRLDGSLSNPQKKSQEELDIEEISELLSCKKEDIKKTIVNMQKTNKCSNENTNQNLDMNEDYLRSLQLSGAQPGRLQFAVHSLINKHKKERALILNLNKQISELQNEAITQIKGHSSHSIETENVVDNFRKELDDFSNYLNTQTQSFPL